MNLLIYLIKTVLISGLLLGYYWLFLRNRIFHGFNRFFLLIIPAMGLLLPALHFSMPSFWNMNPSVSPIRLLGVGRGSLEEVVTVYANRNPGQSLTLQLSLVLLSITITLVLFFRIYKNLRFLYRLGKNKPTLILPEATLFFVSEPGTPFSFFRKIFWDKEMDLNSFAGSQILKHEIFHVKNYHSFDILYIEILSVVNWFNPFFNLIRREMQAIHEYGADAYAIAGADEIGYAGLLLLKVSGSSLHLTHPFFKNQIKRRINMITKSEKTKKGLIGRFMILPLIAILICLFSFKFQHPFSLMSSKSIRVVIDAGHGGVFPGVQTNGIFEKNINLSIAKKIQSLSKEYNVDVIMTRENDEDGAGTDLSASLNYRTELAGKTKADLFISIHANATGHPEGDQSNQSKYSGFEIYVPDNLNKMYDGSVKLASSITDYIKMDYPIASELKERTGHIRVLDYATVPAIVLECGYMDNRSDLAYLTNEKNQEKIARDILEGIRKYSIQNTRFTSQINNSKDSLFSADTLSLTQQTIHADAFSSDTNVVLTKVDVDSEFPGGVDAWLNYLLKNLKYPESAALNEIQGEVVVEFIVNRDGTLSDVKALSGPEELRAESIRIIKESGKWIPAMNKGKKVDAYKKQPINYKLSES